MAAVIRARLGAARLALHSLAGVSHTALSNAHAKAILDTIAANIDQVDAPGRLTLVEQAANVDFTEEDMNLVMKHLLGSDNKRRSLQDYTSLVHYPSGAMWADLTSADGGRDNKLLILFNLAASLNMRLPSEYTLKAIASMVLCLMHDNIFDIPGYVKKENYNKVKTGWHKFSRLLPVVCPHIVVLPPSPVKFKENYKSLYDAVFPTPEVAPIAPALDMAKYQMLESSYRCRGGALCQGSPDAHLPDQMLALQDGGSARQMNLVANTIMQQMDRQSRIQEAMFMRLLGRGVDDSDDARLTVFGNPGGNNSSLSPGCLRRGGASQRWPKVGRSHHAPGRRGRTPQLKARRRRRRSLLRPTDLGRARQTLSD